MRTVRALAAALCVALVVASASGPAIAHVNHVEADAQLSPDGTVVVESAYVAGDGYLTVQRDDDGDPGEVLGHRPLSGGSGFQTELNVSVDESAWRNWTGATTVHLVLRTDDGDGEFDPSDDDVLQAFGRPTEAVVTLERGNRGAVSARSFSPLRTEGGAVPVRYAALPTSGHLVVENASDGRAVGSVALDAGVHRDVAVPLDGIGDREENLPVRAVLYRDDGDGTFTGDEEVVVAGDEPVATRFTVEPGADGNGTATPPLVTTATPFSNGTPTTTPTASATATDTRTESPTATGGQSGLGVGALAVAALLGGTALARRRRRRR
jgi:hypothetical protein